MKNNIRVSIKAVKLVYTLTKKGEFRGDVFVKIDKIFNYPKGTTAKHFGKIESVASKKKKILKKNWGNKNYQKPKQKSDRRWGKIHSTEELKDAWWKQEEKRV